MKQELRVLAVADPAMLVYADPQYGILEKYARITGRPVIFDIVPWNEFYPAMMAAFQGEGGYDIVTVAGHLWLKDFVEKGYLSPLSESPDDLLPAISREVRLQGKIWLSPSFCDGHMILYRRSVVQKAIGYDLPKVLSTTEFVRLVKLIAAGNSGRPLVQKAHASEIFLDVLPYFWEEGCKIVDPVSMLPDVNSPAGLRAMERWLSLNPFALPESASCGNDEVREAFQSKRAAIAVTWCGQLGVCLDQRCQDLEDVGFSTFSKPFNVTWSFAINSQSKNKEAAEDLLLYLASPEIDRLAGSCAGAPVRNATYLADSGKYAWYELLQHMISNLACNLPAIPDSGPVFAHLYEEIHQAYTGRQTAAEAMERADAKIRQTCRAAKK